MVHCAQLIMVALCNSADHYIFILWFLSIFYLFFIPRLISVVGDCVEVATAANAAVTAGATWCWRRYEKPEVAPWWAPTTEVTVDET